MQHVEKTQRSTLKYKDVSLEAPVIMAVIITGVEMKGSPHTECALEGTTSTDQLR